LLLIIDLSSRFPSLDFSKEGNTQKTTAALRTGGRILEKLKKFLNNFEGYFCIAAMILMSIVVFIQVVFRFIIKSSLPWSEELSRYLLVWVTFLGGAYGVRKGAHIGIEAFSLLLPKKAQKLLSIFVMILCVALCFAIFVHGISIVNTQLEKGQLSPAMRIPIGYMYAAIPVGMVVFIIRYIQEIISAIKDLVNGSPEEVKKV